MILKNQGTRLYGGYATGRSLRQLLRGELQRQITYSQAAFSTMRPLEQGAVALR